ncbi:MAG: hypothetical protein Q7S57_06135 [bacterium]|nr:hypothetical protein [bacterium]
MSFDGAISRRLSFLPKAGIRVALVLRRSCSISSTPYLPSIAHCDQWRTTPLVSLNRFLLRQKVSKALESKYGVLGSSYHRENREKIALHTHCLFTMLWYYEDRYFLTDSPLFWRDIMGSHVGMIMVYLDSKDSLALRYLMENDHGMRHDQATDALEAVGSVVSTSIGKLWDALDNLELFMKHQGVAVVQRDSNGSDREFDWNTVCDRPEYDEGHVADTNILVSFNDFLLLEASLRRAIRFITPDRIPSREEMLRIAIRLRAATLRRWHKREEIGEFGIRTPNGLLPLF